MKNLFWPGICFIGVPFLLSAMINIDDQETRLTICGWILAISFLVALIFLLVGPVVAWKRRREYINDGTLTEDEADTWYIRYWGYDNYNMRMQSDQNKKDRERMKEIKKKIKNRNKK